MRVRLVGHEAAGRIPAAPATIALTVEVEAVGLGRAILVPLAEGAVAHAGVVVDLARGPSSLVPEAPRPRAQTVVIVVTVDARGAIVVPDGERRQLISAGGAPEQRIGG